MTTLNERIITVDNKIKNAKAELADDIGALSGYNADVDTDTSLVLLVSTLTDLIVNDNTSGLTTVFTNEIIDTSDTGEAHIETADGDRMQTAGTNADGIGTARYSVGNTGYFDWSNELIDRSEGKWLKLNGQQVNATDYPALAALGMFDVLPPGNGSSRIVLPNIKQSFNLYDNQSGNYTTVTRYGYVLASITLPHIKVYAPTTGSFTVGQTAYYDHLLTEMLVERDYGNWIQTGQSVNLDEYPALIGVDGIVAASGKMTTDMTANASGSQTVTASSTDTYYGDIWKAFDGAVSTYWSSSQYYVSDSDPAWLKIDFGESNAVQVNAYGITVDSYTYPRPKDWKLQGSNDNTNWTDLDSRTNYTEFQTDIESQFPLPSVSAAYRYIRLRVTAQYYDSYDYLRISELAVYGSQGYKVITVPRNEYGQRMYMFVGTKQI